MAFAFVVGQSLLINWFFLGLERMHFITFATLIGRILFAVLVFTFVRNKEDDFLFLLFLGIGNIVAGLASIAVAFRIYKLQFMKPSKEDITRELQEGWQITLSHLSNSTCNYANIFILGLFVSDLAVGYYSIAERIFFTIKQAFVVFSQAVYPKVCQLVEDGKDKAISFLKQVYLPFFLLVILGCIVLFIFSSPILYFFMGDEYRNAVFYLRVFSVIAVIVCLNIPGTLMLLATNQKKSYLKVYVFAIVLNILLNSILARFFEATGTVITIFITEFFITMGLTGALYRNAVAKGKLVSDPPDNVGY
jgi:PST family polysaccharide transporter